MSPPTRRLVLLAVAGALVAAAAALALRPLLAGPAPGGGGDGAALERLDDYGRVPDFALTDQRGQQVSRADLRDLVWVANFIYTECRETCPTQSLHLARLQGEFAGAPRLRLVSITVDPAHDTPEVLARYAERYGADPERWLFLTGDRRDIYCLATAGFRLSVVDPADPSPPACAPSAAGPVTTALGLLRPAPAFAHHGSGGLKIHSARLVLVDGRGQVRAYHQATDPDAVERLRANLRRLLEEAAR